MTQTDREPNYTNRYIHIHSDSQVFDEILFPSAEGAGKVSENIEKLRNSQKTLFACRVSLIILCMLGSEKIYYFLKKC